ncbi:hypothetical protein BAL199_01304 [alpha proteobacterium BAL199]|nr:hypothetical protein BAL199_01304 [alpha proteobacterium BAL199]
MTVAATSRPAVLRRIILDLTLLLSAACGLVVEIVAGRLIAPYVGMSLYTWTAIIAVVLAGLSAGHWIGGQLATAQASDTVMIRRLSLALVFASVSSLASLGLLRMISGPLLSSGMGDVPAVILLCTALFLLPSLFVGIVAPIVTRLAVDQRPNDPGPVIGRMYALGTLGSIAGTLSAGYLFIAWIGSTGTIVAVAVTYAGLAVLCALYAGLRRVLGRRDRYLNMLSRFLDGQSQVVHRIRSALAEGEAATAEREAHTARSTGANIGASAVAQCAEAVEVAIRTGEPAPRIGALIEALDLSLQPVLHGIAALAEVAEPQPQPSGDTTESAIQALNALSHLLADDDAEAQDLFAAHGAALRETLGSKRYTALASAIDQFDFETARSICAAVDLQSGAKETV